jgi:acyl carrier protein
MTSITERITDILLHTFKIHRGSIGSGTTFADLGFDSIAIVELALVLDNEFGIALEDGELADTMTTTDAAELILVKGAAP